MSKAAIGPAGEEYRFVDLRFSERVILCDDDEPSRFLHHWRGQITWEDPDDSDTRVTLGTFALYFVDLVGALTDGVSCYEVFDTHQSTFEVFETLFDHETYELREAVKELAFGIDYPLTEGILILDRLVIAPEHRGHAVGLLAMKALVEQFRGASGIAVLKAFPLQFEGSPRDDEEGEIPRAELALESFSRSSEAARSRLKKYYGRLGFRAVPGTEYMVMDPGRKLPAYEDLKVKAALRVKKNVPPPKRKSAMILRLPKRDGL